MMRYDSLKTQTLLLDQTDQSNVNYRNSYTINTMYAQQILNQGYSIFTRLNF